MVSANHWFVCFKTKPLARTRLVTFPYAGGGTVPFRPWDEGLGLDIEHQVVRLPGRESRIAEKPIDDLETLFQAMLPALREKLDRPTVLFGHSFGSILAFEAARRLESPWIQGVIVSGRQAPTEPPRPSPLHGLPKEAFVRGMCERYNAIPKPVLDEPEMLELILPALRADMRIAETFHVKPTSRLKTPLVATGGRSDPHVTETELAKWSEVTSGPFRHTLFDGAHFYLQDTTTRPRFVAWVKSMVESFL